MLSTACAILKLLFFLGYVIFELALRRKSAALPDEPPAASRIDFGFAGFVPEPMWSLAYSSAIC
jgi:hypothetical protein